MVFPDDFYNKHDNNKLINDALQTVRDQKVKDIQQTAEKTATPIVEAVKDLTNTVKDFGEISSKLSKQMIRTIERFEVSSSEASNRMIWLTGVIGVLTVVIAILTVVMIFK